MLMVFGHAPVDSSGARTFVYSFHMPLFFVLSGYLYKKRSMVDELKKCFRSLYLPYFIYVSLLYAYSLLHFGDEFSMKRILLLAIGALENTSSVYGHLWFLVCLASIRLMIALLTKYCSLSLSIVFAMMTSVVCADNLQVLSIDVFQIKTAILCIPFFLFGMIARKYDILSALKNLEYERYGFIVMSLLFIGIYSLGNGEVDVFNNITGHSLMVFYMNAILLSFILMYGSCVFLNRSFKVVTSLSGGTLLVLAFHKFLIGKSAEVLGIHGACGGLVLSVIVVLLFYYPVLMTNKIAPWLLGRCK